MTTMLEPILGNLDNRVIIVFIVIMAICIILTIIKKVFKLAIILTAIAIAASLIMPMASDFQEKYQFKIEDGAAIIKVEGNEFTMSKSECKEIEMVNKGVSGYELRVTMTDGVLDIMIPTFMIGNIEHFADRYGIPIDIKE